MKKLLKIKILKDYSSGIKEITIPDNNLAIDSNDGCIVATESMNEESNNYVARKGAFICDDIFTVTGLLDEQEARVLIENDEGKLINDSTIKLTKENHKEKGYSQWTFSINGETIYVPEGLFNLNSYGKRVDMNRAALLALFQYSGIPFREDKSNDNAFKLLEKDIKDKFENETKR